LVGARLPSIFIAVADGGDDLALQTPLQPQISRVSSCAAEMGLWCPRRTLSKISVSRISAMSAPSLRSWKNQAPSVVSP
jgi:hypothetical protein